MGVRVAALAATVALSVACGGPVAPVARPTTGAAESIADAGTGDAAPALRSLASLAASGDSVARGMREIDRGDIDLSGRPVDRDLVRAAAADTCARVAFSATGPVRATLVDGKDRVVAEADASSDGAIGERGPVCARRGESLRLRVSADGPARVRFVAWAAP